MRILVVEDNPLVLLTSRVCLENMGGEISEAGSCSEAEHIWKTRRHDLVVMDYRLPDGFGTDLIAKMREAGYNEPVICLTAETESITESIREQYGISAVLNKPLDISLLREETKNAIAKADAGNKSCPVGECRKNYARESVGMTEERQGGFRLVKWSDFSACADPDEFMASYGEAEWLAFDMRGVERFNEKYVACLIRLAGKQRDNGGRLCIAGVSGKLFDQFDKSGLLAEIDVVRDVKALESVGRRLSSVSERKAVLGSVIKKEG